MTTHPADPDDVRLLTDALAEFAEAVREQREPVDVVLPDSARLADVAEQVDAAFQAVCGPDFTRSWFPFRRRQGG